MARCVPVGRENVVLMDDFESAFFDLQFSVHSLILWDEYGDRLVDLDSGLQAGYSALCLERVCDRLSALEAAWGRVRSEWPVLDAPVRSQEDL